MSGDDWRAVWTRLPDEVRAQLCRMIEGDPTVPSATLVIDCEVHAVEESASGEIMVVIELTSGHCFGLAFDVRPDGAVLH
jgi:hypothetical protein